MLKGVFRVKKDKIACTRMQEVLVEFRWLCQEIKVQLLLVMVMNMMNLR